MPSPSSHTQEILIKGFNAAVFLVICAATFVALFYIVPLEPFGHDESVYLTKARSWIDGSPADQWDVYRPIAMSYFAWIIFQFGNSEFALRTFGIVFGAITPGIIFLLFRRLTNLWVALSVVIVAVSSSLFLKQAPLFLNDIPSAMILLALLWLLYIHFESAGKSNSVYLAAPLAALAFYLRYGTITTLAMIAIFSYLILLPRFLKKENASFSKLGKTLLVAALLFVVHFIYSLFRTGKLFGVLTYAGEAAHPGAYVGEGLVQYIKWLPAEIGGWPLGIAAILGAATVPVLLAVRQLRHRHTGLVWIGCIGLSSFILTGLLTHAEPRYVLFPMLLLSGVGIAGAYYLVARWTGLVANVLVVSIAAASIYFGIGYYRDVDSFYRVREVAPASIEYSKAHAAIRADSVGGSGCSLWLFQFRPRASWYTGCNIFTVTGEAKFREDFDAHPENTHYSLVYTRLTNLQITADTAAAFGVTPTEIFHTKYPAGGDLLVYRLTKAVATTTAGTTTSATTTAP